MPTDQTRRTIKFERKGPRKGRVFILQVEGSGETFLALPSEMKKIRKVSKQWPKSHGATLLSLSNTNLLSMSNLLICSDQGASKQHLSAARKMNEGYTFAVEFAIRLLEQGKEQWPFKSGKSSTRNLVEEGLWHEHFRLSTMQNERSRDFRNGHNSRTSQ